MTHVMLFGANVRKNERLKLAVMAKLILDIGNVIRLSFGFKNS